MAEDAGGWRKFHNEKFYNLYSSPNINGVISLSWVARVACVGVDLK
jgi:hypothetical protein